MSELEKVESAQDPTTSCNVSKETVNEKVCVETSSPALDLAEAADKAEAQEVCAETSSPAMDIAEAADEASAEKTEGRRFHEMSKEELLETMRGILAENRMEAHKEVTAIKQAFFNIKTKENLDELNAYIDAGNDPSAFSASVDESENEFKTLYADFKEKRAAFIAADEARRKENLDKKNEILDKMTAITEDIDTINVRFPEFQQLQADFKAIRDIPATAETETWKRFQTVVEQFYDHLKMNKELRDLDFKKNLEAKKALIEEARALSTMSDPIAAFRALQGLHEKWRDLGPVAKELRESLWEEFREVSAVVNRRHQEYFEQRKASELANEQAKTAICEEIEGIDISAINSFNEWNAQTDRIIALQKKWRECGFASRKVNNALYARFREACDKFFNAKTEYYKKTKDSIQENLEKKTALCEKAEALAAGDDIKKATAEVVRLQAEWKTIGSVPRKQSDALWARFQTACNSVFDARKKVDSERRHEENANLEAKKEVIEALKALPKDGDRREVIGKVKELQAKWQEIGFVPFRVKEKIYLEYRAICDELYKAYGDRERRTNMANFQNRLNDMRDDSQKMNRERANYVRALDAKKAELKTIENNMGFFNIKSSAGNSMVKEMERKIARLKEEMSQIEEKIALIDAGE